ncbi:hypothetical protein [Planktotalea sp.]|uniref:hypothetical protein n=1 Tax=Planktotalea sp. TaxID=2029877 RepID=UPI003D6C5441
MTKFAFAIAGLALCAATVSSPAFAGGEARVLRIVPGLCEDFKGTLKTWASGIKGHGAYALPIAPRSMNLSCDNPGPIVPVGQSYGFDNMFEAEQAALNYCEEHKPTGFSDCLIVARSLPTK